MGGLYVTSIVVHVLAVAVWLGGGVFLGVVLAPVLRRRENREAAAALFERAAMRFRVISWVCLGLTLVTGALSLALRGVGMSDLARGDFWKSSFGLILGHKLALVLISYVLTVVNDLRVAPRALEQWRTNPDAPQTVRLRKASGWMGRVNLLLAVAVVALAVKLARGGL